MARMIEYEGTKFYTKEYIKDLFLRYVACSSISGTEEEVTMGNLIYDELAGLDYFKQHPEYLAKHRIPSDPFGRFAVSALVRGRSPKTVIISGHFDIVDYDGYGDLKEYALHPYELAEHMSVDFMDEDAREDMLSGNWLFGRGTGDMKFGIAQATAYIMEASLHPDFDGSVLFVAVPDEENNSAGMMAAIPALNEIRRRYGLEYRGFINNEPHFKEDGYHLMDMGGVGKIMPAVFCVGKEGHAGVPFEALNADPMLAAVLEEIEFSMDYVDQWEDVYTLPTTTLKMSDNKTLYSVSMPYVAYAYFTVSTLTYTPEDVINLLKASCQKAMEKLTDRIRGFCEEYNELTGEKHDPKWDIPILTYNELYNRVKKARGDVLDEEMETVLASVQKDVDERDATIAVVRQLIDMDPDKSPKIVLAYIPPFYSHTVNRQETASEKRVWNCAEKVAAYSKKKFGIPWKQVRISKQISDGTTCCNVGDMSAATEYLVPNMPLLGNRYVLPIEDLEAFDVPAMNIGYHGKGYHQTLERIDIDFALNVSPVLLSYAVSMLLVEETDEEEEG